MGNAGVEVGGVEELSEHEHTVSISEEWKYIERPGDKADGNGAEGTLEGSSVIKQICEKVNLRVERRNGGHSIGTGYRCHLRRP